MPDQQARRLTIYNIRPARPRWTLLVQATFWRVLMGLGMLFHKLAPPRPPKPSFIREIPSTLSGKPGVIVLHFYVPKDYTTQRRLWIDRPPRPSFTGFGDEEDGNADADETDRTAKGKGRRVSATFSAVGEHIKRRSMQVRRWGGYPVVINFHGGGFTLGTATDDARWCGTVVHECNSVVISVDYRLAPECPFPTAVEDGVDAVIWVHEHADELGIDPDKIALSGFSSGGNMAVTIPLRLYDEQTGFQRDETTSQPTRRQRVERALHGAASTATSASSSSTRVASGAEPVKDAEAVEIVRPEDPSPPVAARSNQPQPPQPSHIKEARTTVTSHEIPDVKIRCIVPWYPSLDYTRTRAERRATCLRQDQELPALFTNLFDEAYLHPAASISLDSPYLSPGVAPTSLLQHGLPDDIILHTCEWDMLLDEGQEFYKRLTAEPLNKNVTYCMIEGVPHGWDKAPNPWKPTPGVKEHYLTACKELKRILGQPSDRRWSAAPRGSVQVVN